MRNFRNKYKIGIAVTFLCSYLILFSESIFHIHHYDLAKKENTSNLHKVKNNSDPFALDNSFCLLEHLCSTINFDGFADKDIFFFTFSTDFSVKPEFNNYSNILNKLNFLRAPPKEVPKLS